MKRYYRFLLPLLDEFNKIHYLCITKHSITISNNILTSIQDDHTEVKLVQTSVPSTEADVTRNNWDRYYWESMKKTFGFGAFFT